MKKKKPQTINEVESKNLVEDKKKKTKKIHQKDYGNKNDLDNSEKIQKMKTSCKSKKIDSVSPEKDSKEFTQKGTKGEKNTVQRSTDSFPKEQLRTVDSGTSEIVPSPKVKYSETKRRKMQSGWFERTKESLFLYCLFLYWSFKKEICVISIFVAS